MTKKEILRNNKFIAKFMGEKLDPSKIISDKTKGKKLWVELVNRELGDNTPPYNLSWDWLMPVVDKINEIGATMVIRPNYSKLVWWYSKNKTVFEWKQPRTPFDAIGGKHYCRVIGVGKTAEKNNAETKIEAVYNNVVYFIKWYNKNVLSKKTNDKNKGKGKRKATGKRK